MTPEKTDNQNADDATSTEIKNTTTCLSSSSSGLPSDSPLEIISRWMMTEERRALMIAQNRMTTTTTEKESQQQADDHHDDELVDVDHAKTTPLVPLDLQASIDPSSSLYKHLPGWIKCYLIVTPQRIVIHKAQVNRQHLES